MTSPTDAAAVFSVLRVVPLPKRLTGALEAESGLNDAPTVVLVTLVSTGASQEHGIAYLAGIIAFELAAGVLIGLAVGFGGAWVMRRAALPSSGLYPLAVLVLTFLAYAVGAAVHASGFAAVYVAALVLGNSDLPHRTATRSFSEGMAWLAQIGLFVMLGLLLSPGRITVDDRGLGRRGRARADRGRPTASRCWSARSCSRSAGRTSRSCRGPVCEAPYPSCSRRSRSPRSVDGARRLFNIVFVMVVIYTMLTGPTLPLVARWLKVARRFEPRDLEVEAAPLERVAADLLQVTISPKSLMHGVEVGELRLPKGASVSMVIRDGETLVPERRTVLRRGDELVIVTPRKSREATEERLRQVSIGGRLAQWLGTQGPEV